MLRGSGCTDTLIMEAFTEKTKTKMARPTNWFTSAISESPSEKMLNDVPEGWAGSSSECIKIDESVRV